MPDHPSLFPNRPLSDRVGLTSKRDAQDRFIDAKTSGRAKVHYIDAAAFTDLFRRNGNNQKQKIIAEAIYLIAQNFIGRYSTMNWLPLEDAASEAALIAIKKIWHFTKKCEHDNAFNFFTKIIQREVVRYFAMEHRRSLGLPPTTRKRQWNESRGEHWAFNPPRARTGI